MHNFIFFKKINYLLAAIIVLAIIIRLWGIGFGLPNTNARPDEDLLVCPALNFFTGDFNPQRFTYGSLYMYFIFGLYFIYYAIGLILGKYHSPADIFFEYAVSPTNFYLINRLASVFFGVATVYLVYLVAKKLFGRKTACISSWFMAIAYLHVRNSHFGVTDVPMTFFILCSILFIIAIYQKKDIKNYLLAGIFAGVAASIKYAGILLIFPLLYVHFLNRRNDGKKIISYLSDWRLFLFFVAAGTVFMLGSPYAIIDFKNFLADFSYEMGNVVRGHYGIILGRGWWYHFRYTLFYGLGWSLWVFSLAGIIILFKQPKKALMLLLFPLIYYFISARGYSVFSRYILPITPFLCIAAGLSFNLTVQFIKKYLNSAAARVVIFCLLFVVSFPSLSSAFQFDRLLARPDSRLVASDWINKNISSSDIICQGASEWGRPELWPATDFFEERCRAIIKKNVEAAVLNNYFKTNNIKEFRSVFYNKNAHDLIFGSKSASELPDIIIAENYPLAIINSTPQKIENIPDGYVLIKSFETISPTKRYFFDQQDAFYLPYAGFSGVIRPGPNLYIYRLKP